MESLRVCGQSRHLKEECQNRANSTNNSKWVDGDTYNVN